MMTIELVSAASTVGAAILIAGAAIGSGLGVGQVGAKFLEGAARQPHIANELQVRAFLMSGLLDAVPMLAVATGMLLLYANPLAG